MFDTPIDVILTFHDVVQPDLVVVTDPALVSGRGIEGPPTLVAEVLSPTTTAIYSLRLRLSEYNNSIPPYLVFYPCPLAAEIFIPLFFII